MRFQCLPQRPLTRSTKLFTRISHSHTFIHTSPPSTSQSSCPFPPRPLTRRPECWTMPRKLRVYSHLRPLPFTQNKWPGSPVTALSLGKISPLYRLSTPLLRVAVMQPPFIFSFTHILSLSTDQPSAGFSFLFSWLCGTPVSSRVGAGKRVLVQQEGVWASCSCSLLMPSGPAQLEPGHTVSVSQ